MERRASDLDQPAVGGWRGIVDSSPSFQADHQMLSDRIVFPGVATLAQSGFAVSEDVSERFNLV